jgi:glutamine synthetase
MTHSVVSQARARALEVAGSRTNRRFKRPLNGKDEVLKTSQYFGCYTYSFEQMETKLSADDVKKLRKFAVSDIKLSEELANNVALAAKEWALAHGATHYCHWFQPQTGSTAEKHDSFLSFDKENKALEKFDGNMLIQSEPDASSFPSGGRRSTFEARGYTAWDASSPMFLRETDNGLTLCIPSLFISYTGEALDKKTPLLRSIAAVNKQAVESLRILGSPNTDHVNVTAGPEQEYFLLDSALFNIRPDLVLCGRTLFGRVPTKGQQLEDHYFGSIKPRILNFMIECEHELYKLGVPCKTRHNEVAPSQCEMAPIFEAANVAADHNQLVMEVLSSVGKRHNLEVLFHEKPYLGMNGSGKHVNWSLSDSDGANLLEPGDNPHQNLRFLYFLIATIKAIHDHGAVLRASVASAGNDFRLGANEAPPAIMSAFLGETLSEVLDELGNDPLNNREKEINLDLTRVPVIKKDSTDRNRTSPFAFTGNKFEFRALGSSMSISPSLTNLNTTVAQSLSEINARILTRSSNPTEQEIVAVLREVVQETKKIRFEGNNYSDDWHSEASSRGLPNLPDTPIALTALLTKEAQTLFETHKVYSKVELNSRYLVQVERYNKIRMIEIETLIEMISTHILPATNSQLSVLGSVAQAQKDSTDRVFEDIKTSIELLSNYAASLRSNKTKLQSIMATTVEEKDEATLARLLADKGTPLMEQTAEIIYHIELECDDQFWALPKTRELIYMI